MLDQELLAKAEANDVQAIFEVAKAYYIGDGVEENNEKAFELFSKVVALDPNFPDVYSRIGRCYEKGWGTAQDLKKAVDAYTTGANLNSAGCHYYLALAYENGTGVVQDEQKAIQHYLTVMRGIVRGPVAGIVAALAALDTDELTGAGEGGEAQLRQSIRQLGSE